MSRDGSLRSIRRFRRLRRLHRTAGCGTACCALQFAPVLLVVPITIVGLATGSWSAYSDLVVALGAALTPIAAFVGFRLWIGSRIWSMVRDAAEGYLEGRLPVLLDAQTVGDRHARTAARDGLLTWLPRASEADTEAMSADHWDALHRLLRIPDDPLRLAVLAMLERVGGVRSLWHVEGLAGIGPQQSSCSMVGDTPLGREAARILPVVRERARRERERATLLRPGGDDADAVALLRPASGTSDDGADALLRPSAEVAPCPSSSDALGGDPDAQRAHTGGAGQ
ncbi:MAG TPA: hypothetical protein VLH79_12445 [Chthonomonadales bacterium]|nr:hypothetical protein [Chthonomonadales bacterium]